jgi:tetratricopeptide (TPR) repeat protein
MYDEILNRLNSQQWERDTDPRNIMFYCAALVETKRQLPREITSPSIPRHVSEFVQGCYSFRQGKLRESLRIFSELARDKDHHLWGDIGLLAFSLETGNISNMKRPLERLEAEAKKNPAVVRTWDLLYYKAWYAFYSGNHEEVEQILNNHKDSLAALGLSELKVTVLLRQDRFDEAEEIIRKIPSGYQVRAGLDSELIKLKYGSKKCLEYLRKKKTEYPRFRGLESKYADALVDTGEVEAATEVRKKLVQERPFDFFVQLAFAAHQLYHGNLEEAKDYLIRLDYPPEVNYYDVLLAAMYKKQNLDMKAWEYLGLAKKLFPRSPYVLSGIMSMALKERDFDKQYAALKESLEIDPNDIATLVAAMFVHCFRKEYDQVLQAEKRINASKRYVDPEMREKIELVKAKCLVGAISK